MTWTIEGNKLIKADDNEELDLRLEAAAIEYKKEDNAINGIEDYLPEVDWINTSRSKFILEYDDEHSPNEAEIAKLEAIIEANPNSKPPEIHLNPPRLKGKAKKTFKGSTSGMEEKTPPKSLMAIGDEVFKNKIGFDAKPRCKPKANKKKPNNLLLQALIMLIALYIYYHFKQ